MLSFFLQASLPAKDKLKELNKQNKGNVEIIKQHMIENELTELNVGGLHVHEQGNGTLPTERKNLEEIIEDQYLLDRYRLKCSIVRPFLHTIVCLRPLFTSNILL